MNTTIDFTQLGDMLNDWVKPIFFSDKRFIVCKGGAGSGKSYSIGQMLVYKMLSEEKQKILVIRKYENTLRGSCYDLIKEIIFAFGVQDLFDFTLSPMEIRCKNGNVMIFKGLNQDAERIKSINAITKIWIEEAAEVDFGVYKQLRIRLRTPSKYPLQMFISFNPVSIVHWLKAEFFDNPKANAVTIETNYKDNRFLPEESKNELESFKYTDEYYYQVYCQGNWGTTGKTVFNGRIVTERLLALKEKYKHEKFKIGYFKYKMEAYIEDDNPMVRIDDSSIKFIEDESSGYINIYKNPTRFHPHVIGADTAGEGSDYSVAQVINNISGEQVATLRIQNIDEDKLAEQLYCLGKYYNNALISVEINFSAYTQKHLEKLNYSKLYMREQLDTIGDNVVNKLGFRTTTLTRPAMISNLVQLVREHPDLINDETTLEEMLTFIRNEKGKPCAEDGAHDDTILSLSIAYFSRTQESFCYIIEDFEDDRFTLPDAFIKNEEIINEEGDIW